MLPSVLWAFRCEHSGNCPSFLVVKLLASAYLLVRQMLVMFYIHPYLELCKKKNSLVVIFLLLSSLICYLDCNSQPFRGAWVRLEPCSDLLQGSCPFFFFFGFLRDLIVVYGFVSNLHPSMRNLVT